jgi:hypothetical protein
MVILKATSNLGGQKEDKGMMSSITRIYDRSLLNFDPMVILRVTSILREQKENKRMICNIPITVASPW